MDNLQELFSTSEDDAPVETGGTKGQELPGRPGRLPDPSCPATSANPSHPVCQQPR